MIDTSDRSPYSRQLWALLQRLREQGTFSQLTYYQFLDIFAGLILVRHAESLAGEGQIHTHDVNWEYFLSQELSGVHALFSGLAVSAASNNLEFLDSLPRLSLRDASPELMRFAIERVTAYDFMNQLDRQKLCAEFDAYLTYSEAGGRLFGQPVPLLDFDSMRDPGIPRSDHWLLPQPVSQLIVSLVAPQASESVYDPFCGLGSFLGEAARFASSDGPGFRITVDELSGLFGRDPSRHNCLVAAARSVLSGAPTPHLQCIDSLVEKPSAKFKCIITCPPFGIKTQSVVAGLLGITTTSVEVLAMQHVMATLAPKGRAVVVVPEGLLFRGGKELQLRRILLDRFSVDAVVSLPNNALAPITSLKTNALVLTNRPPQEKVLFVSDDLVRRILDELPQNRTRLDLLSAAIWSRQNTELLPLVKDSLSMAINSYRALPEDERSISASMELSDCVSLAAVALRQSVDDTCALTGVTRDTTSIPHVAWELSHNQLAERSFELLVKPETTESLMNFLQDLVEASPGAQITSLSQLADVFNGVKYDARSLVESVIGNSVPFFRVQDLTSAEKRASELPHLGKPRKRLSVPHAKENNKHKLALNDILVSGGGTIGAVALTDRVAVGGLPAADVIVVRPKNDIEPAYLVRMLQSLPYRDWMHDNARGSMIRHLSAQTLKDLPIVQLPQEHERKIIDRLKGGEDARTIIKLLKPAAAGTGSVVLVNESDMRELMAWVPSNPVLCQKWWDRLAKWISDTEPLFRQSEISVDPNAAWLRTLAKELLEAKHVAIPADRFAILQSWRNKSAHQYPSASRKEANSPEHLGLRSFHVEEFKERFLAIMFLACRAEMDEVLCNTKLSATALPTTVTVGQATELEIQLSNEGSLAALKVEAQTSPVVSKCSSPLLKPGELLRWTVMLTAETAGVLIVNTAWSAERLDGTPVHGSVELAIESVPANDTSESQNVFVDAKNPYVCGAPIDDADMFYGRQDQFDRIKRSLRTSGPSTVIILEGNRRAGKTSICKQLLLAKPDLLPGWIRAYWSLQAAPGDDRFPGLHTREVYYNIARALCLAAHSARNSIYLVGLDKTLEAKESRLSARLLVDKLRGTFSDENAFHLLDLQIESVFDSIGDTRILLMLDEFEKLQEGIDNGITSPQVPENIRDLFQRYNKLSGIITGSKRIKRLRQEYWSVLYGIGIPINVAALDPESAKQLVERSAQNSLVFSQSATDYILQLCSCQPFLIQQLCHCVFERCASTGQRSVTTAIVEQAQNSLLEENEHFAALWQYAGTDRRRYLAYLVYDLSLRSKRVTSTFLSEQLESEGVNPASLDHDLSELRELEVLEMKEFSQGNTYHIAIPLFALWMTRHKDFALCKEKALAE